MEEKREPEQTLILSNQENKPKKSRWNLRKKLRERSNKKLTSNNTSSESLALLTPKARLDSRKSNFFGIIPLNDEEQVMISEDDNSKKLSTYWGVFKKKFLENDLLKKVLVLIT